jgi:hypothetical protein
LPKALANKLPKGNHVFYVDGTNQAAVDPKPARFKFSM